MGYPSSCDPTIWYIYFVTIPNHVVLDPQLLRPAEVELLLGDASKAKRKLGWSCEIRFKDLVQEMVEADLRALTDSHRR